jgi:hypothetical protein
MCFSYATINPNNCAHFGKLCTLGGYQSCRSAGGCSRQGVIAFFADVVIPVTYQKKSRLPILLGSESHGIQSGILGSDKRQLSLGSVSINRFHDRRLFDSPHHPIYLG